ncbi:HIT family protein [Candidatus Pacearchaeota archaeon]|nr:HIT family protein [Candidatus Pacearchaeota archaeon]
MEDKECIFCKIVKGEMPCEKVYEDDNFIGILEIKPQANGHTLLIPKKHFRNLFDMPSTLGNELIGAMKEVSLKLIKDKKAEGVKIIINNESAAGQIVFHLHSHIIPRNEGDGLIGIV